MKSILFKICRKTFKNIALISIFSVFLTACGSQESADPKSVDLKGPSISLSGQGDIAVIETKSGTLVDIPVADITFQSEDIIYYQKNDDEAGQVISIISDNFDDIENIEHLSEGQTTQVSISNKVITYSNLDYQNIQFDSQDIAAKKFLHLEYQSSDSKFLDISLTSSNDTAEKKFYNITKQSNDELIEVDIPLSEYPEIDLSTIYQLNIKGDGTLKLSNIYFHGEKIDLSIEGKIVGFRQTHKHGEVYTLQSAAGFDIFDGPVETDVEYDKDVFKINTDQTRVGTHTITYTAKDSSGHLSVLKRYVDITDQDPPIVTLLGENPIILSLNDALPIDEGSIAVDAADENLDLSITVSFTTDDGSQSVPAVNPSIAGEYKIRYTYTDDADNSAYVERVIIVAPPQDAVIDVLKNGIVPSPWDQGISAYDQGIIKWGSCSVSVGCPNIGWEFVDDSADESENSRGKVLEITHEDTFKGSGVIISSSTAVDIRGAKENGFFTFDLKVMEGIRSITFNADCGYPCAGGTATHTVSEYNQWETVAVPVASLIPNGPNGSSLDLERVRSGLVIQAYNVQFDDTKTVFRIDNAYYDCRAAECEGVFVPFVPVDWAATHENPANPADTTPTSYEGYTKVWGDEFNGNAINPLNWSFDIGTGDNGWGNGELQYYRPENAKVEDGLLIIEARKHQPILNLGPNNTEARYTSSKLKSEGLFDFKYGRVDIRAVVAKGQGMWSAGWMLGSNHSQVGWPYSGEIDIFDTIGGVKNNIPQEGMIVNNMYWNGNGSDTSTDYSPSNINNNGAAEVRINETNEGLTFSNTFHTFSLVWDEEKIEFQLDGETTKTINLVEGSALAETYRNPFYLILNVAVGGAWPGAPDDTTDFPDGMLVDYVRVYQVDSDGDGVADYELDGETVLDEFPNDAAQQ